jgi:hypothetical protein
MRSATACAFKGASSAAGAAWANGRLASTGARGGSALGVAATTAEPHDKVMVLTANNSGRSAHHDEEGSDIFAPESGQIRPLKALFDAASVFLTRPVISLSATNRLACL